MKLFFVIIVSLWAGIIVFAQDPPRSFQLHGSAQHKVAGIFKVLNGYLYLESPEHADSILSDVPKKLEFVYLRNIKADLLIKNSLETLTENQSVASLKSVQKRIDRVSALFKDVKDGDRYALSYTPGVGTELAFNGNVLDCIQGADFAAVYFSIWFGEKPLSQSFKAKVLSGAKL